MNSEEFADIFRNHPNDPYLREVAERRKREEITGIKSRLVTPEDMTRYHHLIPKEKIKTAYLEQFFFPLIAFVIIRVAADVTLYLNDVILK